MTCMISDPDWFHPFSCHASPETSLVSLGEFFFLAVLGLHCIEGNGTPLLPGNSHERRSLEGCSAWGRWGSKKTEQLHFHFHSLEKEMATHSTVLAWRIPAMAEPGGLPSMGSQRVGHDWSDLAAAAAVLLERECTWLVKNKDFETDCLCQNPDSAELQTVWPWASSLTTLGPCFYVSKNGDDDNITCIAELLWRLN